VSARKDVADKIRTDNPMFKVHDFPLSPPENLATTTVWVNVYREGFSVNDSNSQITHALKATVVTAKKGTAAAEDELDAAVDAVMLSLEALPDVFWQSAQRVVIGDSWEGYEITLTALRAQVYKSQILTS
jgi:predicted RNase H-like nuclease